MAMTRVNAALLNSGIVSKTTTYTAKLNDNLILCSGSAFTVTLPAAASSAGKILELMKTDASLTNIITIDGNASETINGATTTTLNTQYECVKIACDGSNWVILSRRIPGTWTSFTPTGSWSTNTTYTGLWRRIGDVAEIRIRIALAGAPTNAALSFDMPTGMTIDTTKLLMSQNYRDILGECSADDAGVQAYPGVIRYGSTSLVRALVFGAASSVANDQDFSATVPFTYASGDGVQAKFQVPVSGWNS